MKKAALRELIAKVIVSEGCRCCEGRDHGKLKDERAKALDVPRYGDDSGFDWHSIADDRAQAGLGNALRRGATATKRTRWNGESQTKENKWLIWISKG